MRLVVTVLQTALLALFLSACSNASPTPTAPPPSETAATVATPQTAADTTAPPVDDAVAADKETEADVVAGTTTDAPAVQAPIPTPTSSPTGQLTVWHSYAGADADALAAILDDFTLRYPDIGVDTLFVAYNDLPQAYADAVAVGGGPDLVFAPNWWVGDLVAAGAAAPLDDLLGAVQANAFLPAATATMRWDGRLYALPVTVETIGLYVNNNILPPGGVPQSTDEWLALVRTDPAAGVGLYTNLYHLYWGIPAYGGLFMDDEGVMIMEQTPGVAAFLRWLDDMADTDGNFVDQDYGALLDRFKKSEFPFFVDGPWAAPELVQSLGSGLTVARLPAGPAGPSAPWLSADGVVVNPVLTPEQQALALLLADALTDAAAGGRWAQIAGRIPAHQAASTGDNALLAGFRAQAVTAVPMPARSEMDEVWGYGGDMIVKVLNDVMDADAAVLEASALINEANGK